MLHLSLFSDINILHKNLQEVSVKYELTNLGFVCSLGTTLKTIVENASKGISPGFSYVNDDVQNVNIPFFKVDTPVCKHTMRCYDLLDMVVEQLKNELIKIKKRYKSSEIGIVIGNTNTGIHEAQGYIDEWIDTKRTPKNFSFTQIELGSPAIYLKNKLGTEGPAYVISTACSSSAKVFKSAINLLKYKICKVVLVGGVDSRCRFAQNGFFSLNALSKERTIPFSLNRNGINLGEAAALFIMKPSKKGICIKGVGESSDAYDLTHPAPSGEGAIRSMEAALKSAKLLPNQIDFINLHGTGTIANDSMEAIAVNNVFGTKTPCASTKPLTGHTLGASGAVEVALSWLMLKYQFLIPHIYDGKQDTSIPYIKLTDLSDKKEIHNILSNSFAFGGSNVSVIIGKENEL